MHHKPSPFQNKPREHQVAVKERTIPKTTSGKIQRRKARVLLKTGGLDVVQELHDPPPSRRRRPAQGRGGNPEDPGGVDPSRAIGPGKSDYSQDATPVLTPEHHRHVPHMLLRKTRRASIAPGPRGHPDDNDKDHQRETRPPRPLATAMATAMATGGDATATGRGVAGRTSASSGSGRRQALTATAGGNVERKHRARATVVENAPAPAYDAARPPTDDELRATYARAVASTPVRADCGDCSNMHASAVVALLVV